MELCLRGSLVVEIKEIITTLLSLFSNVGGKKTLAASKKKPLDALLPQNCHFLYHVLGTQLHFVDLWQSEYSVYSMSTFPVFKTKPSLITYHTVTIQRWY